MKFRLFFILSFFTLLYFAAILNIYGLQVKRGDYYMALALSQQRLAGFLEPLRGNIYFTDRNSKPVEAAITRAFPSIFSVPMEIDNPESAALVLAPIVNIDADKLVEMFNKPKDEYELLVKKASVAQIQAIQKLGLKGIYTEETNGRFYPFRNLAANVLGFVGQSAEDSNLAGKYGLEFYYDEFLAGTAGKMENGQITDPVHGKNIQLTIDPNIQTRAEDILQNLILKFKAEKGLFIVQEPKTGKILAMGGQPSFDPNDYSQYKLQNFLNPAAQAIYEPGSVMKVITMAGGLDAKKITPQTTFYDSGSLSLDGWTIKNWDKKAHGKVTMTEVIEESINTGAAFAERQLGNDLFYNYLVKFGFGEKTGLKFPGELNGNLDNLKKSFREINFATASFGQGISLTPIQLINAISVIANGGTLMRPYLTGEESPFAIRRVISEEAARQVTAMMLSAVNKAMIARIPKYDIAGKTGTAQIPDFKRGGYTEEYIHTYVGFAPAFNPRFTVLIRLDKPAGAPLAGLTVVPAFRELTEYILNYYNIPPDRLE